MKIICAFLFPPCKGDRVERVGGEGQSVISIFSAIPPSLYPPTSTFLSLGSSFLQEKLPHEMNGVHNLHAGRRPMEVRGLEEVVDEGKEEE